MYEEFYEMKRTPFVRNIPSEELYESPAMAEAFARLNYAADRQLFAVLTSDAGCGKSTLIRRFNDNLPKDRYILLYVSDSKLTPKWLYKSLLDQLEDSTEETQSDYCRSRLKSSVPRNTGKSSAFLMKPICWKRKRWKSSGSC